MRAIKALIINKERQRIGMSYRVFDNRNNLFFITKDKEEAEFVALYENSFFMTIEVVEQGS